jgi:hypothetical protein
MLITGVVEDVKKDEERLLVRPDLMPDEVVELELSEVQKLFQVRVSVRVRARLRVCV